MGVVLMSPEKFYTPDENGESRLRKIHDVIDLDLNKGFYLFNFVEVLEK